MKKLFIIAISLALAFSASAQGHRGGHAAHSHITIIGGYAPLRPYYGFGYGFGYDPFYDYPFYTSQPSKLDLQIEDIQNDYKDRIWSVKHDKSLTRQDRKVKVHELNHEKDTAILDAKKNYYHAQEKS